MASARALTAQGRSKTRIRVQSIDVDLSSPPEYPIGLKILLNSQLHQRIQSVPTTSPLHWDNINPIDTKLSDQVEIRIYEHHSFGYRKIHVGTVVFRANQVDDLSTEITLVDNVGLVPCSVKLTFPSPEEISSIPHSVNKLAVMAVRDKTTMLDSMGRTRDVVGTIMKIGQQASELNPVAKVTFGLCNLAWQTLEKQDKYDKLVVDLVLGMNDLIPLVDAVKSQAKIKQLQAIIMEILQLIEDASRFVIEYESNGAAVRTIRAFVSSTAQEQVDEFLKQFKRLKEAFDIGITAQVILGVETVLRDTDQEILMKLIAPDAGYNPAAGCLEGTRTAVQMEIQGWTNEGNVSQSIYWISGLAGSGKSTIAHSACHYLDGHGRLAGSFFCKRDNEQLNKPESVVSTLAANLGFQCQPYGAQLVAALRKDPRIATKALLTRFEHMIVQPLRSMSGDALPQTSFIIVDALDECGTTETRVELARYLTKLVELAPWIKILMTCRRDHRLESYLKNVMVLHKDLSNDYKTSVVGDIERLIRHRLKVLMDDDEMLALKPWLEDGTVTRLTAQANELFIWAQTTCNIICKSTNPDRKIEEMLSEGVSRDAMTQLHSLYGGILYEALGDVTGGADVIRSCIAAVVVTRIPLTDVDMVQLLESRVELVELRRVIRRLSAVLYRDQHGTIRVIHQSFSDYMQDEQCPPDYRIHKDRQNVSFGASCLSVLFKDLKFNICRLENSRLFNHEVADLSTRIERNIPTYLRYSCLYWVDHLLTAGAYTSAFEEHRSALALLSQLLQCQKLLYWVEVMSLLGNLHECETALVMIKDWIPSADTKVQKRIEDLQRLVTDFYLPISQSTPHLYVSALALSCSGWENTQRLQNEFPNRVQVVRGSHLARLQNRWSRPIPTPGSASAVAYSPDGRLLAVACSHEVLVFDALTSVTLFSILHNGRVTCVSVSPNSQCIISGSEDHEVRLWDINTSTLACDPLLGHTGSVTSVAFSPTGQHAISGSEDRTIRLWDVHPNIGLVRVLHHPCPVSSVDFSPDGSQILSGSDKIIRLWDACNNSNKTPQLLHGHGGFVESVAFSPNGHYIASLSINVGIRIWNIHFGHSTRLLAPREVAASFAFSPDSQCVVCGTYDGVVRFYDVHNGAHLFDQLLGHYLPVTCLAFSPDSLRIASGSEDCTVRLWDARPHPANTNPLQAHSYRICSLDCSPDGKYIASGSEDKTVRVWDARTGAPVLEPIVRHTDTVTSVAFSPDSQCLASGSLDGTVWVWDLQTGIAAFGPLCHSSSVGAVVFSSDGRLIASTSNNTNIHLWDAENGAALSDLYEGDFESQVLEISSPDDQGILSAVLSFRDEVALVVWDVHNGAILHYLQLECLDPADVALSSGGRFVAGPTDRSTVVVWEIEPYGGTVTQTSVLRQAGSRQRAGERIALSPDGLKVVPGFSYSFEVWDAGSGNRLSGPFGSIFSLIKTLTFSRNGQRILSGSEDGRIDVWDISETGIGTEGDDEQPVPGYRRSEDYENGWQLDLDGKLFLWVPHIYHKFHIEGRSNRLLTISTNAEEHVVSFDFTKFKYGKDWASIRASDLADA